jgi:hypothetical protein
MKNQSTGCGETCGEPQRLPVTPRGFSLDAKSVPYLNNAKEKQLYSGDTTSNAKEMLEALSEECKDKFKQIHAGKRLNLQERYCSTKGWGTQQNSRTNFISVGDLPPYMPSRVSFYLKVVAGKGFRAALQEGALRLERFLCWSVDEWPKNCAEKWSDKVWGTNPSKIDRNETYDTETGILFYLFTLKFAYLALDLQFRPAGD